MASSSLSWQPTRWSSWSEFCSSTRFAESGTSLAVTTRGGT
jgi:hypothetical protein